MASSTSPGSRSSNSTIRSYSESVSPSWRWRLDGDAVGDMGGDRFEDPQPVDRAGQGVHSVLGVRHQPEDVPLLVADAGDVVLRSVGILTRRVAENHMYGLRGVEPSRGVLDRDREAIAGRAGAGERRVRVDHLQL